ncbi:MAG: SpoIIE family protein phosphatase [Pseudomonadota bacterium]
MTVRVMVVDDEPDVEEMLRQRLRRRVRSGDLELIFASDGHDALAKLAKSGAVDLVLTDINMPGMDGLTLLSHLTPLRFETKTVVVSAYGDIKNIRTAMNRGAFDFITKPIEFDDLEKTIERTADEVSVLRRAARHATEMNSARLIQSGLLPNVESAFSEEMRFDLNARIEQAREVGGDFYDFYMTGPSDLFLVIGDVSGKGLASGILMAMTKSLIKASAYRHKNDPSAVLNEVNSNLCNDNPGLHFVTLTLVHVNCATGYLKISSAGHEPVVLCTPGQTSLQQVESNAPPIGITAGLNFRSTEHQMAEGEAIVLMTDGLSEANDPSGNLFGRARISTIAGTLPSDARASALVDALFDGVAAHRAGAPQSDDLAVLAMIWRGGD